MEENASVEETALRKGTSLPVHRFEIKKTVVIRVRGNGMLDDCLRQAVLGDGWATHTKCANRHVNDAWRGHSAIFDVPLSLTSIFYNKRVKDQKQMICNVSGGVGVPAEDEHLVESLPPPSSV